LSTFFVRFFFDLLRKVEIVPADAGVSDEPLAAIDHFLCQSLGVDKIFVPDKIEGWCFLFSLLILNEREPGLMLASY
jgi:hypothetical protein